MKQTLRFSEWLFVGSFLVFLGTLVLFSKCHQHYRLSGISLPSLALPVPLIQVTVEGAVLKPGVYSVESGTSLRAVLKKAKLDRYADVAALAMDQQLVCDEIIKVSFLDHLVVYLESQEENLIAVEMPIKSRVSDLKKKVEELGLVGFSYLKGRKLLQSGDVFASQN